MELRQLEHFVAVADERHFTRAAEGVGIVQSGLSASIRFLERELGSPLFIRSTRRVTLTAAGQALLPEARRALAAARAGREAVEAVEGLRGGQLAIGVAQVVVAGFDLIAVLADFQRDYPLVELNLWQAAPVDHFAALRTGRLDLAFVPLLKPPDGDLEHIVVARDRIMAVCAPDHPLARRRSIRLNDLAAERFVDLPESWTTRQIIDGAFDAAGLVRRTTIVVNDIATCLELVRRGLGVSLLPEGATSRGEMCVFVPLARALPWDFALVRRADGTLGPAAREFLRRILSEGAEGPEGPMEQRLA
jgi:DNA-binding transcriptional LysR family regulator